MEESGGGKGVREGRGSEEREGEGRECVFSDRHLVLESQIIGKEVVERGREKVVV